MAATVQFSFLDRASTAPPIPTDLGGSQSLCHVTSVISALRFHVRSRSHFKGGPSEEGRRECVLRRGKGKRSFVLWRIYAVSSDQALPGCSKKA